MNNNFEKYIMCQNGHIICRNVMNQYKIINNYVVYVDVIIK